LIKGVIKLQVKNKVVLCKTNLEIGLESH
jgi:hypothetical protein